jgi:hypothetical protein
MDWVAEIIDSRGGTGAVAAALDLPETTVSSWKSRGIIRPGYWPSLIAIPPVRGAKKLTLSDVAKLACEADADRLSRDRAQTAA